MFFIKAVLAVLLLLVPLATLRILYILPSRTRATRKPRRRRRGGKTHLLIVLGSGGHTAEMTAMLRNAVKGRSRSRSRSRGPTDDDDDDDDGGDKEGEKAVRSGEDEEGGTGKLLDWRAYTHRTWVISSGDSFSAARARELEAEFAAFYACSTAPASASSTTSKTTPSQLGIGSYEIATVPRARKIHQSLLTTPLSSLNCLVSSLRLLCADPHGLPDLILTNGPATATIVVLATLVLRFADVRGAHSRGKCRTVYVESWARVKRASLSGRLLCRVVERVLVQWEQLDGVGGRGEYMGVLV